MTLAEAARLAFKAAYILYKSYGATKEDIGQIMLDADKEIDAIDRAEQEARTREQEAARGFIG